MAGHLFVLQGDLTALACDAWLVPSNNQVQVILRSWSNPDVWPLPARLAVPRSEDVWAGRLVLPMDALYPDPPDPRRVWLGRVGRSQLTPAHVCAVALEYLERASAALEDRAARFVVGRARPLLAMPLLGTGYGGGRQTSAQIVRALVETIWGFLQEREVDVAVVAWTDADFAALQSARRDLGQPWPLSPELQAASSRLARRAADGQLAIFLGAGVSKGANQPLWWELLNALADEAGLPMDDAGHLMDRAFERLNVLDQAAVLARRFGSEGRLRQAVCALIQAHPAHSLAHGLLAGLPTREFITTNYDALFERACAGAGRPVAALPREPDPARPRWLLKMHGSVEAPDSIVLTRESYLRYSARNEALAGIVQAALITRHMLFVGFSMEDDNFHRIVDAVRRAVRPRREVQIGEVLTLAPFGLRGDLWGEELNWVDLFDPSDPPSGGVAEAARRQEIFLDHLSAQAASSTHLLKQRYAGALSPSEASLRGLLLQMKAAFEAAEDRSAPGWARVEAMLKDFGG